MNEKLVTLSLLKEFRNKIKQQDIDDKLSSEDISFEYGEIKIKGIPLVKPLIEHQSLENYITINSFEDLAIDKGFSKLTLGDLNNTLQDFKLSSDFKNSILDNLKDQNIIDSTGKVNFESLSNVPHLIKDSDLAQWVKSPSKPAYTPEEIGAKPANYSPSVSEVLLAVQGGSADQKETIRTLLGAGTSSFDGNYSSLQGTPSIPTKLSQLTNDSNFSTFSGNYSDLKDIPQLLTIDEVKADPSFNQLLINKDKYITDISNLALKSEIFSGDYSDLKNTPTLITSYNDLKDKPELFDGNYNSLSGKPDIPSKLSELTNDAGYSKFDGKYSSLADKPDLFTGDYNDLVNLPFIPKDISELEDNNKLILNLDTVKSDPQLKELIDKRDKYAQKSDIPLKLSDLDNDTNFTTLDTVKTDSELAHKTDIVTSYLELKDKPSIPSDVSDLNDANNIILTISNIKQDEAFAQLITNKDKYLTQHLTKQDIENLNLNYNKLSGIPTIPTKLSQLSNDEGFTTLTLDAVKSDTDIATLVSNKNKYLTEHQSLTDYAKKVEIPSDISQLTDTSSKLLTLNQVKNNISYNDLKDTPDLLTLAEVKSDAGINQLLSNKDKYLTQHQSLEGYQTKIDSNNKLDYTLLSGTPTILTTADVDNRISSKVSLSNGTIIINGVTIKPITQHQDLSSYAKTSDIPSNLSDLVNDKNFITSTEASDNIITVLKNKRLLDGSGNTCIGVDDIVGLGSLATKNSLTAAEVGARASDWVPTAEEINSSLSTATLIDKVFLRKNLGLGSLATKSSIEYGDVETALTDVFTVLETLVEQENTRNPGLFNNLIISDSLKDKIGIKHFQTGIK